jgi:hypothetical protein
MFESAWEDWASLQNHRNKSPFEEGKMLHSFELKIEPFNIREDLYEEIA